MTEASGKCVCKTGYKIRYGTQGTTIPAKSTDKG